MKKKVFILLSFMFLSIKGMEQEMSKDFLLEERAKVEKAIESALQAMKDKKNLVLSLYPVKSFSSIDAYRDVLHKATSNLKEDVLCREISWLPEAMDWSLLSVYQTSPVYYVCRCVAHNWDLDRPTFLCIKNGEVALAFSKMSGNPIIDLDKKEYWRIGRSRFRCDDNMPHESLSTMIVQMLDKFNEDEIKID